MSDNFVPPPPPPVLSPPPSVALAPPAPTYAGFWIRAVAWLIDTCVLVLLRAGTGAVIRISAGLPPWPSWRMRSWSDAPFDGIGCSQELVGLVLWWLYHAL